MARLLEFNVAWGFLNTLIAAKLAEYRSDDVSADSGMRTFRRSMMRSFQAANYREPGRRVIPWYTVSFIAQAVALIITVLWLAFWFEPR